MSWRRLLLVTVGVSVWSGFARAAVDAIADRQYWHTAGLLVVAFFGALAVFWSIEDAIYRARIEGLDEGHERGVIDASLRRGSF